MRRLHGQGWDEGQKSPDLAYIIFNGPLYNWPQLRDDVHMMSALRGREGVSQPLTKGREVAWIWYWQGEGGVQKSCKFRRRHKYILPNMTHRLGQMDSSKVWLAPRFILGIRCQLPLALSSPCWVWFRRLDAALHIKRDFITPHNLFIFYDKKRTPNYHTPCCSVRGHVHTTSSKFLLFWTPSLPLSVPNSRNLPSFGQILAIPTP